MIPLYEKPPSGGGQEAARGQGGASRFSTGGAGTDRLASRASRRLLSQLRPAAESKTDALRPDQPHQGAPPTERRRSPLLLGGLYPDRGEASDMLRRNCRWRAHAFSPRTLWFSLVVWTLGASDVLTSHGQDPQAVQSILEYRLQFQELLNRGDVAAAIAAAEEMQRRAEKEFANHPELLGAVLSNVSQAYGEAGRLGVRVAQQTGRVSRNFMSALMQAMAQVL